MSARTFKIQGVEHTFDAAEVTNVEGMSIEKVTGLTFDQWNAALAAGSMSAMTALVWLLQRRNNPALRFNDVEFKLSELVFVKPPESDSAEGDEGSPRTDLVEGGSTAEFNVADPTPAEGVSTDDA